MGRRAPADLVLNLCRSLLNPALLIPIKRHHVVYWKSVETALAGGQNYKRINSYVAVDLAIYLELYGPAPHLEALLLRMKAQLFATQSGTKSPQNHLVAATPPIAWTTCVLTPELFDKIAALKQHPLVLLGKTKNSPKLPIDFPQRVRETFLRRPVMHLLFRATRPRGDSVSYESSLAHSHLSQLWMELKGWMLHERYKQNMTTVTYAVFNALALCQSEANVYLSKPVVRISPESRVRALSTLDNMLQILLLFRHQSPSHVALMQERVAWFCQCAAKAYATGGFTPHRQMWLQQLICTPNPLLEVQKIKHTPTGAT